MIVENKFVATLCVWLLPFYAFAQNTCHIKFSGTVRGDSNDVLSGASIILSPGKKIVTTDSTGWFSLENLCPGIYEASVQYLGYKTQIVKVNLIENVEQLIRLSSESTELKEVIVQDELLNVEHAQNFSALSRAQLARLAGKSLGESLKEIPGVNTIQSGPGIFKPVIHGVHSLRVLILNYGIRQEGQQWGAEHAPEIDPFIASDIVVIKDASALKYGSDALGGVIVVNPPALPEKAGLGGTLNNVLQSNGRSGTISGMLQGGIKNHDGWGWRLQGTLKQTGDYHAPEYTLTNTGNKELNFSAATGYHVKNSGVEFFFSRFETALGILKGTAIANFDDLLAAMEREPPEYTSPFSYSISEPRQEVSHNLLKLNAHRHTDHGALRIQYSFQNNNRKEFDFRIGSLTKTPSLNLTLNTHTLHMEWEDTKSETQVVSLGMTGSMQENRTIPGIKQIAFIPNFNNLSTGAFGIAKFKINPWTVDLGARYDYRYYTVAGFDYTNALYKSNLHFNNVSITAGGTLPLPHRQTLHVNASTAWRPPHVAEFYSLGTHQSAAAIEYGLLLNDSTSAVMNFRDVNFNVEKAFKIVSTYQKHWDQFQVEVSPYVNYIMNYLYLKPTGITKNLRGTFPYLRYTQTDALFIGLDLSAACTITRHLKAIPRISLLRASDTQTRDYLVSIPSNRYEIALRYEKESLCFFKNFFTESRVKLVARQNRAPRVLTVRELKEAGEQNLNPFEADPSNFDFLAAPNAYWLWNCSAGFSVRTQKVKYDFLLSVDNLMNASYREYTNRFRYYADEIGRNFLLSAKCSF